MSLLRPSLDPDSSKAGQSQSSWAVQLAAIGCLAAYLHMLMWRTEAPDMHYYLQPWFAHIVRYGPVGAFAHPFSDYTPTYLYLLAAASVFHANVDAISLIKLLSVAGTAFAALAVSDLIGAAGGQRRYATLLFILPSVTINAALLGQCDALWAGACVFAISSMIRERPVSSLAWCGLAIGLKLQAIFIAPLIIGALLGRRAPLWQWLVPGAVFWALMVPAWFAGWPAWRLAMVYPSQLGSYNYPGSLANPWIFATVFAPDGAKQYYWVGIAAALVASLAIAAMAASAVRKPKAMLMVALLCSLALPFLLPKMHERYFFLADVIALAAAVACRQKAVTLVALAVQAASFLSLLTYMYFETWAVPTMIGALFAATAVPVAFVLARRSGATLPTFRTRAVSPRLASAERTAA